MKILGCLFIIFSVLLVADSLLFSFILPKWFPGLAENIDVFIDNKLLSFRNKFRK